jgi:hypothetical protein
LKIVEKEVLLYNYALKQNKERRTYSNLTRSMGATTVREKAPAPAPATASRHSGRFLVLFPALVEVPGEGKTVGRSIVTEGRTMLPFLFC